MNRRMTLVVASATVALSLAAAGCASGDTADPAATARPTTSVANKPGTSATTNPLVAPDPVCISHTPGAVMNEASAHVFIDKNRVCPGYVTVVEGTAITFHNTGTTPLTLAVAKGYTATEKPVTSLTIAAGATAQYRPKTPIAALYFFPSVIPSFRGTIEVRPTGN